MPPECLVFMGSARHGARKIEEMRDPERQLSRQRRAGGIAIAVGACHLFLAAVNARADGDPARGLDLVTTNCARCHSVTKAGQSPLAQAPEFRVLHLRYPVEDLAESLAEGISTGHPVMPEFQLEPDQIGDVLVYLRTLER
jgi:mono/diheme cytochrome c family protein